MNINDVVEWTFGSTLPSRKRGLVVAVVRAGEPLRQVWQELTGHKSWNRNRGPGEIARVDTLLVRAPLPVPGGRKPAMFVLEASTCRRVENSR